MTRTLVAVFDGEVFRPEEPVLVEPQTRLHLTFEMPEPSVLPDRGSFLRTARALQVEGPSDWSSRLEDVLYGDEPGRES
jgi:hypothetical protein